MAADEEHEAAAEAPKKKKLSGKKLVLFIILPIVLLLGLVGGLLASGVFASSEKAPAAHASAEEGGHGEEAAAAEEGGHGEEAAAEESGHGEAAAEEGGHGAPAAEEGGHGGGSAKASTNDAYYDLPDFLVNLNTTGRKAAFLKMSVSLELARPKDREALEKVMPRVVDNFQIYLRELRVEDLRGSAGVERMKEELLLRVNAAAKPIQIKDVLFREMLVQ